MSSWTDTTLTTYTGDAVTNMDLGAVNELEHFDDLDDPITLERREWVIVTVSTVIMHPRTELCPVCHVEGEWDPQPSLTIHCAACKGDGTHPLAGQVEIVT